MQAPSFSGLWGVEPAAARAASSTEPTASACERCMVLARISTLRRALTCAEEGVGEGWGRLHLLQDKAAL